MNESIFSAIRQDIERKSLYYGEIVLSLQYHDGRITSYTITTSERRNCNLMRKGQKNDKKTC